MFDMSVLTTILIILFILSIYDYFLNKGKLFYLIVSYLRGIIYA